MGDPPKKRAWFQYHLSTAIVVTFAAAILLGLNIVPHHEEAYLTRGWPFPAVDAYRRDAVAYVRSAGMVLSPTEVYSAEKEIAEGWTQSHAEGVTADCCVFVALLFLAGCASECWIRRRELRAGGRWIGLPWHSWLLLLSCAVTLLLLNIVPFHDGVMIGRCDTPGLWPSYGWPWTFYQDVRYQGFRYGGFLLDKLLRDLALCVLAPLVTGIVAECIIRRKEAKRKTRADPH